MNEKKMINVLSRTVGNLKVVNEVLRTSSLAGVMDQNPRGYTDLASVSQHDLEKLLKELRDEEKHIV